MQILQKKHRENTDRINAG